MKTEPFVLQKGSQGVYKPLEGDLLGLHVRNLPDVVLAAGTLDVHGSHFWAGGDYAPAESVARQAGQNAVFSHVTLRNDGPDPVVMVIEPHTLGFLPGSLHDYAHVLLYAGESFEQAMLAKTLTFAAHDNTNGAKNAALRYVLCGRERLDSYGTTLTTQRIIEEGL